MKINNFFTPDKIQKKEKLNRTSKNRFSDFLGNEIDTDLDVTSVDQVSAISLNAVSERTLKEEKRAYQTSKKALEQLEELRDNIATGSINLNELTNIKQSIDNVEKKLLNQTLNTLIEEIELRVEVEIAKIEQSFKANQKR